MQIGVDQAEDRPILAETIERGGDLEPCSRRQCSFGGGQQRAFPEPAPPRRLAHQAVGIQGVTGEARRKRPGGGLIMQGRHRGAQPAEPSG